MRRALVLSLLVGASLALIACPTPKLPTGPAPEYEDPPPPSWLEGGAPAATAPADAGAG